MGTKHFEKPGVSLHLVDLNEELVNSWREAFKAFPEVTIEQGDLLTVAKNAVVSPANSFGQMDGGIDAAYIKFFGPGIESEVRYIVTHRPEGHLPIGASVVVPTGHKAVPYLIVAPTKIMPDAVPSRNCYQAMKAVLRVAGSDPQIGRCVYCPGLGTGVGKVPAKEASKLMAQAYREWKAEGRKTQGVRV